MTLTFCYMNTAVNYDLIVHEIVADLGMSGVKVRRVAVTIYIALTSMSPRMEHTWIYTWIEHRTPVTPKEIVKELNSHSNSYISIYPRDVFLVGQRRSSTQSHPGPGQYGAAAFTIPDWSQTSRLSWV